MNKQHTQWKFARVTVLALCLTASLWGEENESIDTKPALPAPTTAGEILAQPGGTELEPVLGDVRIQTLPLATEEFNPDEHLDAFIARMQTSKKMSFSDLGAHMGMLMEMEDEAERTWPQFWKDQVTAQAWIDWGKEQVSPKAWKDWGASQVSADAWKEWAKTRIPQTLDKFNWAHRVRAGVRETNSAPNTKIGNIPFEVAVGNAAAAQAGIHFLETAVIGPAMMATGSKMGGTAGMLLEKYGQVLAIPVPTGFVPFDALAETGCIVVGALMVIPVVQNGIYKLEVAFVKAATPVAKAVGADKLFKKVFETKTGQQKLKELIATGLPTTSEFSSTGARRTTVHLRDRQGRALASLYLEGMGNGAVKLRGFSLDPLSRTSLGREDLAASLGGFGRNIKDAVLKPEMLVKGKHGLEVSAEQGKPHHYAVKDQAVQLKSNHFVPRQWVQDAIEPVRKAIAPAVVAAGLMLNPNQAIAKRDGHSLSKDGSCEWGARQLVAPVRQLASAAGN